MPAQGNPIGADAPHVPTTAQNTQLATLVAAAAAALATLDAARITHKTAHAAYLLAQNKVNQYQLYIAGGQKPGIIDEGTADVV